MVLRMLEGFETKRQNATKLTRIYTVTGTPSYASGRKAGFGAQSNNASILSQQLVNPDENTWIVGFAVRKTTEPTLGSNSTAGIEIHNAGGEQCNLRMIDAGGGAYKMELRRGTTVIDTTTGGFVWGSPKAWMYFQLKVTVRTGTDGVYELRSYDYLGASTVEFSGATVNLANQATDGADRVKVSWVTDSGASVLIDDIVVMDSTGAKNNDFMARPAVILGGLPNAEGNQLDWDPSLGGDHWVEVDEGATTSTDTDKVTAQVIGNIDLYNYEDFALINASGTAVLGVQVISTAAMVASGQRTLRVRVRESAAEATGVNFIVNDLTLRSFRDLFDQNPTGTPADWTKTTLEAAEFGIEIQA